MACMPSRSVTSWMYSFGISTPLLLGQPLAGAERRRCHDIEIAGKGGQVVGCPLDFEKYGSLDAGERADPGQNHRVFGADAIELHLLFEAISGHVGAHILDHAIDGPRDRSGVRLLAEAEDRVTHDDRRFGWIQYDDGFALARAADAFDGAGRGLGEFVDVGAGAGSG